MKKNKGYKYRIYPTEEQKEFFEINFRAAKFAYNKMLDVQEQRYALKTIDDDRAKLNDLLKIKAPTSEQEEEIKKYTAYVKAKQTVIDNIKERYPEPEDIIPEKFTKKGEKKTYNTLLTEFDMLCYFKRLVSRYPFADELKKSDSWAMAYAIGNLAQAYKNLFNKKMKDAEKPVFKKKNCTYTTASKHKGEKGAYTVRIQGDYIRIPKCKNIKIKCHRPLPEGSIIKNATITKATNDDYFISLTLEYNADEVVAEQKDNYDIEYIKEGLFVDGDGSRTMMPAYYHRSLQKLKDAQTKLSKMQEANIDHYEKVIGKDGKEHLKPIFKRDPKECKNYQKQLRKVQRINMKIANQRKDYLHVKSKEITEKYGTIHVNDVSIKEIIKENKAKKERQTILNNGWNIFTTYLDYKANDRGGCVIKI